MGRPEVGTGANENTRSLIPDDRRVIDHVGTRWSHSHGSVDVAVNRRLVEMRNLVQLEPLSGRQPAAPARPPASRPAAQPDLAEPRIREHNRSASRSRSKLDLDRHQIELEERPARPISQASASRTSPKFKNNSIFLRVLLRLREGHLSAKSCSEAW